MPSGLDVHGRHGTVRAWPMSELPDKSLAKSELPPTDNAADPVAKPTTEPAVEAAVKPAAEPALDAKLSSREGPLKAAWAELEKGDHVKARELALELSKSPDGVVSKEANEFIERMKPDPVILLVLLGTAILIAFLAVQYLGPHLPHAHS